MTKKLPLNIILLGDPAAGKATHSAMIAREFPLDDLDMGKELRRIKNDSHLAKKFRLDETLHKGKLTPTQLVRTIQHQKIVTTPTDRGILFDGTPKMLGEAKLIAKWMKQQGRRDPIVLYLSIPLEETVKRISGRGEYFEGKFSSRRDDNHEALRNRARYYRKNISQVVDFFNSKYPYRKISSMGAKNVVQARIMKAIRELERQV
jgi:adenylate kinase family enzyme